jgi:hypothetical protein
MNDNFEQATEAPDSAAPDVEIPSPPLERGEQPNGRSHEDKPHRFWISVLVQALLGVITILMSIWLSTRNVDRQLIQASELSKAQRAQASELLERQLKSSADLLDRQIKANSESVHEQIQASFTVIERQFRLQREQLDEQDKQARIQAVAERKAQCVKDLVEALTDYEGVSEDYSDNLSISGYGAAANLALLLTILPASTKLVESQASDQARFAAASRLANARSRLRSCLANSERLFVANSLSAGSLTSIGTNEHALKISIDAAASRLSQDVSYRNTVTKAMVEKLRQTFKDLSADPGNYDKAVDVCLSIRTEIKTNVFAELRQTAEETRKVIRMLQDKL